jgi:peptidoglycan/LPS O-acetylase OafA/YrhL
LSQTIISDGKTGEAVPPAHCLLAEPQWAMSEVTVPAAAPAHRLLQKAPSDVRYRAYIDGLRAVAVMPVVLYHAGLTTFSGGFVGVDVFFVISGFLITSLITSDLESGRFSLLNFYERRIRRIFPALFAVVAACSIAAWFMFMPVEFAYFGRSVIATALFGSNFLFLDESGYFDTAAQLKPLLHTWSLAVEEQFYIFFPLILVLLYKFCRSRLTIALLILAVASFGLNLWATEEEPEFAFFMSPPRFWELLLGALLAIGAVPNSASRLLNQLLMTVGLGLIAVAVFTYSEATNFPGIGALAPCLGAALILLSGHQDGPVKKLLSARPIVFLGLISYSLYLWHWPIIVFVRYYFGKDPSPAQALLIISASLVISALSWRWIEQPFRRKQQAISRSILFRSATATMASAVAFGLVINAYDGVAARLPAEVMDVYSAKQDVDTVDPSKCMQGNQDYLSVMSAIGVCPLSVGKPTGGPARYVIWGDSHAHSMTPAIEEAGLSVGQSGFLAFLGSCPPLLNFDTGGSKREKKARCKRFNQAVMDLIKDQHISLVFLISRWPRHVHRDDYGTEGVFFDPSRTVVLEDYSAPLVDALDATFAELSRNNIRAVVVMDVPEVGYDVPHALAKAVLTRSSGDIELPSQVVGRRQRLARTVLFAAASKHNVTVIDPMPEFCDAERCAVRRNGKILYADEDHLTLTGARGLTHLFDGAFAGKTAQ